MKKSLFFLALSIAACGGNDETVMPPRVAPRPVARVPQVPEDVTPDAVFRKNPPSPEGSLAARIPDVVERKLSNGMRVLFVTRKTLPLFAIQIGTLSGALDDATTPPVVATAMGNLLEMGTKKFTAEAFSEAFDTIGARHSASMGWTVGSVMAEGPTESLDRVLELVGSAVTEPIFPETEVKRLKDRWKSQLEIQKSNPRWLTWNALGRVLLGEKHPLSHPSSGRPEEIDALNRASIEAFHRRTFVAENLGIAVAGAVTPEELLPKLETYFGKIKKGPLPRKSFQPDAAKPRLLFVEKKGATQSQVTAVLPGVTLEKDPDREAISVADAIFGGMFSSRLNLNLREQHAYTYGSRSSFFEHRSFAMLTAGGAMVREHTNDAIEEIKKEFSRFADSGATESELKDAKEYLRIGQMRPFETVWDTAAELGDLLLRGLPADDLKRRAERLDRVTSADVSRIAKTRFDPKNLAVVVVGDASVLKDQLALQTLAKVEVRGPYGEVPKKEDETEKKSAPAAVDPKDPKKGTGKKPVEKK